MRAIPRIVAILLATAVATLFTIPAAQAGPRSVSVYGSVTAEYVKRCSNTEPYVCGTYTNVASFMIQVYGFNSAVTVGYEFYSGTATAGVDFTGPYTGSVTIQPNFPQAHPSVPVVNDAIAEPDETLHLRITSVSANAQIGQPGQTVIFDGGNVPPDCDLARTFSSSSITCTARPAGQQWQVSTSCDRGDDWPNEWTRFFTVTGTTVTGNGTSTVTCPDNLYSTGPNYVDLS